LWRSLKPGNPVYDRPVHLVLNVTAQRLMTSSHPAGDAGRDLRSAVETFEEGDCIFMLEIKQEGMRHIQGMSIRAEDVFVEMEFAERFIHFTQIFVVAVLAHVIGVLEQHFLTVGVVAVHAADIIRGGMAA